MARPLKLGLDYFPLDTKLEDDVELLEAEFKLEGFAILIKLWQKIYANGYYINWEKDNELLFSRRINAEINLVNSVINGCFQRNLFHKGLHEKYKILTSKGIQDRYLTAASQSKRKHIPMTREYCLVDKKTKELITEFIELTPEKSPKTPEKSPQRKGKERKGKESKRKNTMSSTYRPIIDYLNEKCGTNYRPSTKKTKSLIDARTNEGFEIEDFKTVIDKKSNEWIGTKYEKYLRPQTLFGTNFESYLNQKVTKKGKNSNAFLDMLDDEGDFDE
jgi:uncharacterized phage protein (TIGR02220 family)